jgi:hypothetical protein
MSNGRLQEVKAWRAGEKDKPTSEYMAVCDLVTRWKKAAKRKERKHEAVVRWSAMVAFDRAGHSARQRHFSGAGWAFLRRLKGKL